jgi:hypothetical protein
MVENVKDLYLVHMPPGLYPESRTVNRRESHPLAWR